MTSGNGSFGQTVTEHASDLREEILPLPRSADGFPRVVLVGTTGAGKTTLVRQLIGTHPDNERFPSTSTARTTIADTEIVLDPDASRFRAVVTFAPKSEVRAALQDCMRQTAIGVMDSESERTLYRRLLEHPEQRFRFTYILGNPLRALEEEPAGPVDQQLTRRVLSDALSALHDFVTEVREDIEDDFATQYVEATEEEVREELESEIERLVREDTILNEHVDRMLEEMLLRFDAIEVGEFEVDGEGWPLRWSWEQEARSPFITTINSFTSNHSPRYGLLLTPLVNGIRVSGPFQPEWTEDERLRAVLIDVEGLGHTPDSSSVISTRLLSTFDIVDTILLVDNGQQPMQAASIAAIRAVLTSGNLDKLVCAFTHLDQVVGDNLETVEDREEHVLASAESVVVALGRHLGTRDEQRLKLRIESASVMLGGIHHRLSEGFEAVRTIAALQRLVHLLGAPEAAYLEAGHAVPVYSRAPLEEAVREAAKTFRRQWKGRLGRELVPEVPKEHWARVKALSRRLSELNHEEYDDLRPVADLSTRLRESLYVTLRNPKRWIPSEPEREARDEILDHLMNELSADVARIARRRVWPDRQDEWREAYAAAGAGSTLTRAATIDDEIFSPAAPSRADRNGLVEEVWVVLERVAVEQGFRFE